MSDALKSGISADYVLMDTWFTTEPFISSIRELDLDSIGMVKQLKQHYIFNGKAYTLNQLKNIVPKKLGRDCLGHLIVHAVRTHMLVKIVFIRTGTITVNICSYCLQISALVKKKSSGFMKIAGVLKLSLKLLNQCFA